MIVRIFLFLVFSCVSALAQTFTIGETLSVGNTIDSGNANAVLAQPVTLTQTATLQSLSFYVVNPAGNLVLGLYGASASRAPGQLLAYTQPFVPVAGWNTHPVINQPILVPGTYFLAYFASDNNLSFPIFFSSNWCGDYPVIYSGVFPQSFAFVHGDAGHWAFYATLNVTASPGSNPLSGKHGLKLFGGVQGWHDSSYTPPDPLWKPISQGPATGNQFPSNWWRDDWTFNASQPWGDGTSAQPLLQTASNYCKANGLNGPTIQLWYPGHSPGSWTTGNAVSNMIAYLQFINKYIAPGTFEIVTNETLSGNGQVQNSDPLLIALGGTGKTGWDAIINLVKLMRQYCPNALLGMNDTNMMAQDGSGSMYNQQAAINCYKACHDSGAPMDWLGEEGYWMNSKVATIAGWQDAINYGSPLFSVGNLI